MSDLLIGVGLTVVISAVTGLLVTLIKKGNFEKWGVFAGKTLSRFARLKIGKRKWEKMEDSFTIAIVTFAKGFKKGADLDDNISDDELIARHEKNNNK